MPTSPRVLVTGQSQPGPCGVRDYGATLRDGLSARGLDVRLHWLDQPAPHSLGAAVRADLRLVRSVLRAAPRDGVVVLNYSPFATSWRGVPLLFPWLPVLLRSARVVVVLHEFKYPWGKSGLRGLVWAVTQRVALLPLLLPAAAVVTTTSSRADWVRRLMRRPAVVVPVWSSLPRSGMAAARAPEPRVGCFGWGAVEARERVLALDALRRLDVQLVLVGGRAASPVLDAWRAEAEARGVPVAATGPLAPDEVAAELLALDLYLHLDDAGPASRKSSLATALGLGLPIVAPDGPETWRMLRETGAVRLVPPTAPALAAAVAELLADHEARAALGARATACYDAHATLDRALDTFVRLVAPPPAP